MGSSSLKQRNAYMSGIRQILAGIFACFALYFKTAACKKIQ